jgi:hypothetical protein
MSEANEKYMYNKKEYFSAAPGGSARPACDYSKKQRGDGAGRAIT